MTLWTFFYDIFAPGALMLVITAIIVFVYIGILALWKIS